MGQLEYEFSGLLKYLFQLKHSNKLTRSENKIHQINNMKYYKECYEIGYVKLNTNSHCNLARIKNYTMETKEKKNYQREIPEKCRIDFKLSENSHESNKAMIYELPKKKLHFENFSLDYILTRRSDYFRGEQFYRFFLNKKYI